MTTPAQPAVASSTDSESAHFHSLESYAWANDNEFQVGLIAILGPNPETSHASQVEDLTLHARCFYYERYELEGVVTRMSLSCANTSQKVQPASRLLVLQSLEGIAASGSFVAIVH